jgi:hypothetical protein
VRVKPGGSVDLPRPTAILLGTYDSFLTMTTLELRDNWLRIKARLKRKYFGLSDEDLRYEEGKEDELLVRLQKQLGLTEEEVRDELNQL